jgi:hypothetical protein
MHLITPYAPPTFLKPVLIVSTIANSKVKENCVKFINALNVQHALSFDTPHVSRVLGYEQESEWIRLNTYETDGQALEAHMSLTYKFVNGGETSEWESGYESYLNIYNKYCPESFKEPTNTSPKNKSNKPTIQ